MNTPSNLNNEQKKDLAQSLLLRGFSHLVEWGSHRFTLSRWFLRGADNFFVKLEILILLVTIFCISAVFWIHKIPPFAAMVIAILMAQRVVEFVLVYARNFILSQGRIYTDFRDEKTRGEWLFLMFGINLLQLVFTYSTWYHLISVRDPSAFNQPLNTLDSVYFSFTTFFTIGFGDIAPVAALPKILVMTQNGLLFFILVVVVNGLISMHFKR